MASTIRQLLLDSLEDLNKRDQRKFCARLLDREREGEPRVRRSALEDKDEIGIADVLVSTFTEAKAGRVAVETLRAIECNQIAVGLEAELESKLTNGDDRKDIRIKTRSLLDQSAPTRSRFGFYHGIDPEVPILDKLLEHSIMSKEDYDSIMAKHDPQDLTQHLRSSGT
ncbi:apoptosis-associated speck-like protein containing a CARD [Gadus morhua]|uniref:apoptosis-associated speck-like protein containing a CARD n=1 Tax=Gadus morhua TaxID=8049 RepID=UPI0011B7B0AB|nr:apoptosis-associated speck-like protein containing a CARD [Gadus morhua]